MVVYNYSGKEINAKIVYYGPALSGKTTNLEWIYSKIPLEYSGKMISLRTQTDRTIFFDFLPLELGLIDGFKTRFMLYTVPGQVYYNATRKMVLKGADGVVFVADSEEGRMEDNLESLQNLHDNLQEIGIDPLSIPIVMQWNKRDLPDVVEVAHLERQLNPMGHPSFSACALTGEGIYESLHQISRMIYRNLTTEEGSEGEMPAIDDDSLFGRDIAERLRDIDHPDPTLGQAVGLKGSPRRNTSGDGDVLSTILGSLGSSEPASPVPEEASERDRSQALEAVLSQDATQTAETAAPAGGLEPSSSPNETELVGASAPVSLSNSADAAGSPTQPTIPTGGTPTMSQMQTPPPDPHSGAPRETPPPNPAAATDEAAVSPVTLEPRAPEAASDASAASSGPSVQEEEVMSELVDQLFRPAEAAEDGMQPEEDDSSSDEETFGPRFGRMVDLDSKGQQEIPEPSDEDFELPEDLLQSGAFHPVGPEEEAPEPLELITDPRKLPSEAKSSSVSTLGAEFQSASFKPLAENTRIIEVPLTLDADVLESGKSLRIVLNLKIQR